MNRLIPYNMRSDRGTEPAEFLRLDLEAPLDLAEPFTPAAHGEVVRWLATPLLNKVIHFNGLLRQQGSLTSFYLNHDCGVFAAACVFDTTFDGEPLYGPGERSIAWTWNSVKAVMLDRPNDPPSTNVGNALMTTQLNADGVPIRKTQHFMVRASREDGLAPIYVSKLAVAGAAIIHTFDEVIKYFPADAVAPAILSIQSEPQ